MATKWQGPVVYHDQVSGRVCLRTLTLSHSLTLLFAIDRTMYKPRNAIYPDIKTPRVFLSKIPSGDAGSSLRSHHAEIIDLTADSDSDGEWVDCDDSIRKFIPGPHYTVKKLPPRSMVSSLYPPPPLLPPPPFPPPSQPDNLLINDVSQSVVSANGSASALPSAFAISRDVTSGYAKGNDLYSTQVTGLVVISETASVRLYCSGQI